MARKSVMTGQKCDEDGFILDRYMYLLKMHTSVLVRSVYCVLCNSCP